MQKNSQKLENVISKQINNLSEVLGADLVIGNKIIANDDVTVIPVTKVTLGYVNGGGEYGEVKLFSKEKPFLGGGGAIINMSANGFLIVDKGNVNFIKVADDLIEGVIDKTTAFLEKTIDGKK